MEDHPRVCGEKHFRKTFTFSAKGSPPRVRGKERLVCVHHAGMRITPACAGKRSRCTCVQRLRWDHPRVCGEKVCKAPKGRLIRGSPPRVRGKAKNATLGGGKRGITPACAGKRLRGVFGCCMVRDHPRVCGEKTIEHLHCLHGQGSPPRVRGKALLHCTVQTWRGITPACAGKSCLKGHQESGGWDHPRVCGEKTKKIP